MSDGGRRLVIFDEFPYLVKSDPSLPSVLQNLWDHTLRHANLMIVICGSAMSFIEKELLGEKSPLYGRATGILKMLPMPYWDAAQFFPNYSGEDRRWPTQYWAVSRVT
ncbi:MAG: AAA family ATPase [Collinsella sp.]